MEQTPDDLSSVLQLYPFARRCLFADSSTKTRDFVRALLLKEGQAVAVVILFYPNCLNIIPGAITFFPIELVKWEFEVSERDEALKIWWHEHLCGSSALRLRHSGRGRAINSALIGVPVPSLSRERAKCAARGVGATEFSVWQGLFAVWAWRNMEKPEDEKYDDGRREDVLVVGPFGVREKSRFRRTVGYLLNMLVYRYEVGSKGMVGWSLEELASESTRVILEATENGAMYPFGRLVRESGVRDATALSNVTFTFGDLEQELDFVKFALEKNFFAVQLVGGMMVLGSTVIEVWELERWAGKLISLDESSPLSALIMVQEEE